jgi:hypothetical protein
MANRPFVTSDTAYIYMYIYIFTYLSIYIHICIYRYITYTSTKSNQKLRAWLIGHLSSQTQNIYIFTYLIYFHTHMYTEMYHIYRSYQKLRALLIGRFSPQIQHTFLFSLDLYPNLKDQMKNHPMYVQSL